MSVTEYLDKFTHLSRYALDEVNTDPKGSLNKEN
jgi:hypothetical protein